MPIDHPLFELSRKYSRPRYHTCSLLDVAKATFSAVHVRTAQLVQVQNFEAMDLAELTIPEVGSVYVGFDNEADKEAGTVDCSTYNVIGVKPQYFKYNMGYSTVFTGPDVILIRA